EACRGRGIPSRQVIEGLRTFNGVPGRGELRRSDKGWEITDRNPGISHMSVAKTMDTLERMGVAKDALVILDPVNRKVCEKMDIGRIRDIAESKGAMFRLAGDGEEPSVDRAVTVRLIKEGYQ
ncbi:MAG: coenzyme F430 synthase, partial [Candidatus Methanoplasma sp.]|nr:coenzyme F430 synthase [Candidatus Methanoplasma sp.]